MADLSKRDEYALVLFEQLIAGMMFNSSALDPGIEYLKPYRHLQCWKDNESGSMNYQLPATNIPSFRSTLNSRDQVLFDHALMAVMIIAAT